MNDQTKRGKPRYSASRRWTAARAAAGSPSEPPAQTVNTVKPKKAYQTKPEQLSLPFNDLPYPSEPGGEKKIKQAKNNKAKP
jgi:hypothetical protein